MSIRFAAPPSMIAARMSPRAVRAADMPPANDNGGDHATDAMLHAALRHFAAHGFAAAHQACGQAEAALNADDRQGYLRWLDICRTLDRRMATAMDVRGVSGS